MRTFLSYLLSAWLLMTFAACEDVSDNAIPNIAAPALILIDGGPEFSADQPVIVTAEFKELRKNGVQIDTLGAPSNIQVINVDVTTDQGLRTLQQGVSLSNGIINLNESWESVLDMAPEPGMNARLEFAGTTTDGIPFRKYYTVTVANE